MDYQTKPISRRDLRQLALLLRKLFGGSNSGSFPILLALEKLPDVFKGSNYVIVEDENMPPKTMAYCTPNENSGMTIVIKESVYEGARKKL